MLFRLLLPTVKTPVHSPAIKVEANNKHAHDEDEESRLEAEGQGYQKGDAGSDGFAASFLAVHVSIVLSMDISPV